MLVELTAVKPFYTPPTSILSDLHWQTTVHLIPWDNPAASAGHR